MTKALLPLAALALVSGCMTPAYVSPVEVTRFSDAAQPALGRGTISLAAAPGLAADGWEYAAFQQAVVGELARLGYSVVQGGGQQVAEIGVNRAAVRDGGRRSPVSVGVGGSTGSYGSGVGMGVGIDLSSLGGRRAEAVDTELRVAIKPATGGNALWEGRSRFTATSNSRYGDQRAAAAKLAEALFTGFPGRSGETIEVR